MLPLSLTGIVFQSLQDLHHQFKLLFFRQQLSCVLQSLVLEEYASPLDKESRLDYIDLELFLEI
jgi:hypothetical protein